MCLPIKLVGRSVACRPLRDTCTSDTKVQELTPSLRVTELTPPHLHKHTHQVLFWNIEKDWGRSGREIRELREKKEIVSVTTFVTKIVAAQEADDSTLRAQERYPENRKIFSRGRLDASVSPFGRQTDLRPKTDWPKPETAHEKSLEPRVQET